MPMRVPAMRLSCEGGKWFTSEAPYNADNVCFPEGNYVMLNCTWSLRNIAHRRKPTGRAVVGVNK